MKSIAKRVFDGCRRYLFTFFKWLICAVGIGIVCGMVGVGFHYCVDWCTDLRGEYPWFLFLLPLAGIVIVKLYRLMKMEDDGGTNHIFEAIRSGERVPLRMAPLIFIGTALTHLCGGSSGREGAALQIGGSVSAFFGGLLHFDAKSMRIITMCGMSAVFSALFGTPLTAALFCIEVISIGVMYHSALMPCLVSALTAAFVANAFKIEPLSLPTSWIPEALSLDLIWRVTMLSVLCAVVSILICVLLHVMTRVYKKLFANPYIRIAAAGAMVAGFTILEGSGDYNGAGMPVIADAVMGTALPWAFALKMIFTAFTLGAGFKGGEIIPTMFIGATFGCFAGGLLGIDAGFAAAVGLVAVFCGVVNCPVSCIVLSVEMFGAGGLLYFALACAVSFLLSGRFSLYSAQRIIYSKLEPTYVNAETK